MDTFQDAGDTFIASSRPVLSNATPLRADFHSVADHSSKEFNSQHTKAAQTLSIAIAATFTIDSLRRPLAFWMEQIGLSGDIHVAPYGQVMQELLNPGSLLSRNGTGYNILAVRPEDWLRERLRSESITGNIEHIRTVAAELVAAIETLRARSNAVLLVYLCPESSAVAEAYRPALQEARACIGSQIGAMKRVHCFDHADLMRLYPVASCEDVRSDAIGHIPFTPEYFIALATLLARRIAALTKPQYKVIALDCDNTLWKGICGEDGVAGVQLTAAHLQFQELLVRQHDAGVLLCLCSKNNPADVEAVFRGRPEMILREEHLIASRVNWDAKSTNLQALATELGLGLDSLIFVDDSPMECAEVQARFPSILTLQFPVTEVAIAHFVNHVWAFDRVDVTTEAKRRTAQYKENRAREQVRARATNLADFLASLDLQVGIAPMQAAQLPRVAELIQRTNQFNLTGIRRRSSEIELLWSEGALRILVVHVRDRFGDYGLVGALFFRHATAALDVDTFVLSCRVLGRGVEHRVVNELARIARAENARHILLKYRPTPRNGPAWEFLERSFPDRLGANGSGSVAHETLLEIQIDCAENLTVEAGLSTQDEDSSERVHVNGSAPPVSTTWHQIAYRLSRVPDIAQEMSSSPVRREPARNDLAPRTGMEGAVAGIWADVLGLESVSPRADFFELGGDSLLAVQVIARIASTLGCELSLHEFFEGPTLEEVAGRLASRDQSSRPIERADRSRPLELSWSQQRLWFIDQLDGGSAPYHMPLAIRLRGTLDKAALQTALDAVLARHEALRTRFVKTNGEPVQEIVPEASFVLASVDLCGLNFDEAEMRLWQEARRELAAPFDLSTGPLIRGRLLRLAEDHHVLLLTAHHIACDGWSIGVLYQELGALYRAALEGVPSTLPALPIQYVDYAQWHRQWLAGTAINEQLTYWLEHLRGAPELLELPTDRPRPAIQTYRGASVNVSLGPELTAGLKALSRKLNLTLATTLYAGWLITLSRLSGQEDIVIGMPVANRRRTELEGLIGFFVNTLAMRVRLDDDPTLATLLHRVKETMLAAQAHQDLPFERVVEALQPTRSLSHSAVFQVMFVLQNAPHTSLQLPELTLSEESVPVQATAFDLVLCLQDTTEGLTGTISYASDLFDHATIQRWSRCLAAVLSTLTRDLQLAVSRVPLMTGSELRQVVEEFNATQVDYPQDKLVHELFDVQAERAPDVAALVCADQRLTYGQLYRRANQLAHALIARGVRSDGRVGLYVQRGLDMVTAMLAILKAGGAYVPLDPRAPRDRLAYTLADCEPVVVVTQKALREYLPDGTPVIELDADPESVACQPDSAPDLRRLQPSNLAYVIYTSGSTGAPKGVAIEHHSLMNLVHWHCKAFQLQDGTVCSCAASIGFDAAVWEIWPALAAGATLTLAPQDVAGDPEALLTWWVSQPLDVSFLSTPIAELAFSRGIQHPTLRTFLVGGDRLRHRPATTSFALVNNYGPTESTVLATSGRLNDDDGVLHIGRPIANAQIFILDRHHQPVPIGIAGEIYIGGAGVARGYLNRPELSAERFLTNPFHIDPRSRVYRTGDKARWRADGTIEFIERNDFQVKVRGYRIELGEIEAQLIRHVQVKEAVVLAREDVRGERQLVAYVVADRSPQNDAAPSAQELRTYLQTMLPDYMVPSAFVLLASLPLTANGKLDRRSLPRPDADAYVTHAYEAPRGQIERELAEIWETLLRIKAVGRQDNFFELGGHSLLATRVVSRIREFLRVELSVRALFDAPTIERLAAYIAGQRRDERNLPPLVAQARDGAIPLSYAQEGLWFLDQLGLVGAAYNMPLAQRLSGKLDDLALERALASVVLRHESLRTRFGAQHGVPCQLIDSNGRCALQRVDLSSVSDRIPRERVLRETMRREQQHRFDLSQGPLLRAMLIKLSDQEHVLLLVLHHIVSDGWSLNVLLRELSQLYAAHVAGDLGPLPSLAVQYADHAIWQRQWLQGAVLQSELQYWTERLEGAPAQLQLPTDRTRPTSASFKGATLKFEIPGTLREALVDLARREGVTLFMVVLAAYQVLLARYSGQEDIVVGSPVAGRTHAQTESLIGFFVNMVALRTDLSGSPSFRQLLARVKEVTLGAYAHQELPFEKLVMELRPERTLARQPIFQVTFVMQNFPQDEVAVAGLKWTAMSTGNTTSSFDLTLYLSDAADAFGGEFRYATDLFDERTIERMAGHFQVLLEAIAADPDALVG